MSVEKFVASIVKTRSNNWTIYFTEDGIELLTKNYMKSKIPIRGFTSKSRRIRKKALTKYLNILLNSAILQYVSTNNSEVNN